MPKYCLRTTIFSLLFSILLSSPVAAGWKFEAKFNPEIRSKPFTGRVYVFFNRNSRNPRLGPGWFNPPPFIAKDVKNLKPNQTVTFDDSDEANILAFPEPLSKLNLNGFHAQVVMRFNPFVPTVGTGAGNGYSNVVTLQDGEKAVFKIGNLVKDREFHETKWVKLIRVKSKLLSDFFKRDVYAQGSVRLPASYYDQPNRRYPTIYRIPGFGGRHFTRSNSPVREKNKNGVEFFRITLDPACGLGHHVFADSANNGPVGESLIEELIPAFDKKFRSIAKPSARFLTGHSSGGWSSLWLMTAYPKQFAGTWSTSPDPVDFRDFQRIDIYDSKENMFVDSDGKRRPLARRGRQVMIWYDTFSSMEWVLGHGGQLHSFEAVFSPKGKDGKPMLLWDRKSGKINQKVAQAWKKYDIRMILENNWKKLQPDLKGKIHVYMGDMDTFYLEGATILLKKSLDKLPLQATVEIHPGKTHFSLLSPKLRKRILADMVETFLKYHPHASGDSIPSP